MSKYCDIKPLPELPEMCGTMPNDLNKMTKIKVNYKELKAYDQDDNLLGDVVHLHEKNQTMTLKRKTHMGHYHQCTIHLGSFVGAVMQLIDKDKLKEIT